MADKVVKPPLPATLKKYGLDAHTWQTLFDMQDGKCPICQREFSDTVKPVTDHEHVKGFKKMSAEKKRRYTRGILCSYCNLRRVPKGSKTLTPTEISYNIYRYLADYDAREEMDFDYGNYEDYEY